MNAPKRPSLPDATELLRQMREGERSAVDIVDEHLRRIERLHPTLNAAIEVMADEARRKAQKPRKGPLSGLPVTVKETFALKGHQITAGSLRMPPVECHADAPVVARLRRAGAIIIARSNVPEFVMTPETNNLRWGRTNNPLDPERVAGGSTGGEGALVGSGCSPAGLGTDILGSIRIPGACCGVVGFRPASELVDKTDVWTSGVGFFETWNGIGPLTRSVRDARLVYDVIARRKLAAPADVQGLRLVIPTRFKLSIRDACIDGAVQLGRRALMDAGMVPEEMSFRDVPRLFTRIPRLVAAEAVPEWKRWLTTDDGEPFRVRQEMIRQLVREPSVEPAFFTWFLTAALMKPGTGRLRRIVRAYENARKRYHAMLGDDGILILPTLGLLPPRHGRMNLAALRPGVNGLVTAHTFVNYINLSAITVPAWRSADPETGLVPGVQLACAPGAEARLLDAAAVLEAGIS